MQDRIIIAATTEKKNFWDLVKQLTTKRYAHTTMKNLFSESELLLDLKSHPGKICTLLVSSSISHNFPKTIHEIRNRTSAPIIAAVDADSPVDENATRQSGIFYYLVMPLDNKVLLQVVDCAIKKHHKDQAKEL